MKNIVYLFKNLFRFHSEKKLLIIRLDSLGDYILFHSCIKSIKDSSVYKDYSFTLLSNENNKSIIHYMSNSIVDNYIWINAQNLGKPLYRWLLIKIINSFRFDLLINPIHSPTELLDNFISRFYIKFKIGSSGDFVNYNNLKSFDKRLDIYDYLIRVPNENVFEIVRNVEFTKGFLDEQNLVIKNQIADIKFNKENIITIVPGAGDLRRRWDFNNFGDLINLINSFSITKKYEFILLGAPSEKVIINRLISKLDRHVKYTVLCSDEEQYKIIEVVGKSKLIISNETSIVHIAAAMQSHCICISNGNHFGRFNPYNRNEFPHVYTIYPDQVFDNVENFELIKAMSRGSEYDINKIQIKDVFNICKKLI